MAQNAGMGIKSPKKIRSEEHTSELQSQSNLVCRLLLEKKKKTQSSCLYRTLLQPPTDQSTLSKHPTHVSIPNTPHDAVCIQNTDVYDSLTCLNDQVTVT